MRIWILAVCALLAGCMFGAAPVQVTRSTLTPADAATGLIAGGALTMAVSAPTAQPAAGQDPVIAMTLSRADGRAMGFTEANHTPYDMMAQAAGGPLAQAMGLFGEEAPKLYAADVTHNSGVPFLCAPEGPAYVGVYTAPDGTVSVVGLKSAFEFEALAQGGYSALPYSPDHVCARMHFTRG